MVRTKEPVEPARAKPGPKPKAPEDKVVKKTVSLRPETAEYLAKKGKGVLSHGVEWAVEQLRKRRA